MLTYFKNRGATNYINNQDSSSAKRRIRNELCLKTRGLLKIFLVKGIIGSNSEGLF